MQILRIGNIAYFTGVERSMVYNLIGSDAHIVEVNSIDLKSLPNNISKKWTFVIQLYSEEWVNIKTDEYVIFIDGRG